MHFQLCPSKCISLFNTSLDYDSVICAALTLVENQFTLTLVRLLININHLTTFEIIKLFLTIFSVKKVPFSLKTFQQN